MTRNEQVLFGSLCAREARWWGLFTAASVVARLAWPESGWAEAAASASIPVTGYLVLQVLDGFLARRRLQRKESRHGG